MLMVDSMRILMVNYEFPPLGGGGGHACRCLLAQYARRGDLAVDVLTSSRGRQEAPERFAERITIHKVPLHKKDLHYWRQSEVLEWLWKARREYRRLVDEHRYDLVHAFFAFPSGWLCYRRGGALPYILSLRGSDVPGYNVRLGLQYRLLAGLFRRIWRGASAIVANSEGLRELAGRFLPDCRIGVIPNGIDTEFFRLDQRNELAGRNGPAGRLRLLSVGRLIRRKRIDVLIEMVALARRQGIELELTLAGQGNLWDSLRELAARRQVADRVHFPGRLPPEQMPELYRRHDLFVMASMHEGMSNAMLEALASGLPIVSSPCEGTDELIGANGVVVADATPENLLAAVRSIGGDPDRYRRMAAASRQRAEGFTWQAVADRYIELYERCRTSRDQTPCVG
ncbi:MAG: glycosyltransferase family 4 protein [Sedimentisphaerales bacterium]|nr:glycosyltransferase family 4 protein [Sedimentisphaerales bacterium]